MFPDVGASCFLSKLPGSLGPYLALTGSRLGPADALYTGLATHYMPSSSIPELTRKLEACNSADDVRAACDALTEDPGAPPLAAVRTSIDGCFGHNRVEEIMDALREMPESDWAQGTVWELSKMSPTSCKVRAKQLSSGCIASRAAWRPPAAGLHILAPHSPHATVARVQ